MDHFKHAYCNHLIGKPPGVSDEVCSSLNVLAEPAMGSFAYTSFWQPTEAELELLKSGGAVTLTVYGMHPMVSVGAVGKTAVEH